MRSSSNPAFRNLPAGSAAHGPNGGAPPVGFNQPPTAEGYGSRQAPSGASDRPMTVDDIVIKTGISLATTLVVGFVTAFWALSRLASGGGTGAIYGAMIGGMLVGFGLALVNIFRGKPSAALTLAYCVAEGVFLGAITGVFMTIFGNGIALNAIIGTVGVFAAMLVVYKTGAVKVTPKFTKWIIGALGGAVVLMLANLIFSFFVQGGLGLRSGGPIAIIFSIVVIGIAAFSLLLDFDMADKMIREGMPSKWSWFVAFGLMVTLVWLYLEILRLLSYFQE